jgi:hypothetical protein
VQRLCHRCPPWVAGLLATACLALGATDVRAQTMQATQPAQTALIYPDPFAPKLETNPRKAPRFKKTSDAQSTSLQPPPAFTLPASGAGATGFDASNAPKKPMAKPKPSLAANAQAPAPDTATSPYGTAQPAAQPVSPYQVPPPALADAALAQAPGAPPVEGVSPIEKPLKKRKAHSEPPDPYAPLGIRAGAFDLYPSVEFLGGYDSNPGQTSGGKGAALYTVAPELKVQSNWSRHEFTADLRGSYTGFSPDQTPTLSRPYFDGKTATRIDVTRQTRIDMTDHVLLSTDNPNSPNLPAGLAKLPLFLSYDTSLGIGHRFNRFDLSIKGTVERDQYQDSKLTDGSTASNKDRDYNQYGGTLRGSYDLLPGVAPFAEFEADTRVHDLNTDTSGYQRNSTGMTGRIGSTLKLTDLITGETSIGYTQRDYQDPRLPNLTGFVGNASLIWTPDALNTVKLTGSTTVGESTIAGVSGELSRDAGVQFDHAFRRWLIGSAKIGFGLDDYVGSSREDKRYSAGLGLTYKLSRTLQIKGEFSQNWLRSNVSGNNYAESVFMLGIRLQK